MSRHNNAKPPTASDRHDFGANGKRPDGNPSAKELIAHAVAARTDLAVPSEEARAVDELREAKNPRHRVTKRRSTETEDESLAVRDLPTMGELEQARTDHSRKIATREAVRRAEERDEKAGE
ncbi:hypothetical protein [Rhizobium mulingense]|uniref:hypothetical protein n=1 Tax=Rhizobium mulingense TaxID=3031128 RepID=UPI002B49E593|nr:hypothetical protein [Rhizobium sp. MJ21]MEB3044182.1 hypothetical protein [Rhizobium sp. MJ21]